MKNDRESYKINKLSENPTENKTDMSQEKLIPSPNSSEM